MAFGLTLFVLGSAGCAMSGTAGHLIAWRIVQAVGACAGVVLSRAMVRDLYAGHRAASMLSTLMTVMAVAPLLGPLLGGQVLALAGWRAIFWLLVGVGLLTLAALATLPETLPDERRNREPLARAFARYGLLLREPRLLAYAGAGGFFYGGMFAYIAGSPGAYITVHHVSPQVYGLLFGMGILGIMAANLLNARLVRRTGGERLLTLGTLGAALAGLAVALAAWTGWGGLVGLVTSLFLFITATGFIVANSIAGRSTPFPSGRAPSRRWLDRFTMAAAFSAPASSVPSRMERRGRWAWSSRSPASAAPRALLPSTARRLRTARRRPTIGQERCRDGRSGGEANDAGSSRPAGVLIAGARSRVAARLGRPPCATAASAPEGVARNAARKPPASFEDLRSPSPARRPPSDAGSLPA